MTEKTFCDACGKQIPSPRYSVSVYDSKAEDNVEATQGDLCSKCVVGIRAILVKELKMK